MNITQLNRLANNQCPRCGADTSDRDAKWCQTCSDKQVARAKATRRRNKLAVIAHFGGKCLGCGESDFRCLSLDHVNNDGSIDCAGPKKRIRPADHYARILALLRAWQPLPTDLQLLCFNCHAKKDLFADDT